MRKIRYGVIVLLMLLLCAVTSASARVSIGIQLPNLSIGINLPVYPALVPIPGCPAYYAPDIDANYFFYDGLYWVFLDDYWYASYWYNGPWSLVEPLYVPVFVLRIPVRYYGHPPAYFHDWRADAPPRWGQHWGRDWEQQRKGWNRWKRSSVPARAPLPTYQRQYTGEQYPRRIEQQQDLRGQYYRYQSHDNAIRQHFQQQEKQRAPMPAGQERMEQPRMRAPEQREMQRQEEPRMRAPEQREMQRQEEPRMRAPEQREMQRQEEPRMRAPEQREMQRQEQPRMRAPEQQEMQRQERQPQGKEQRMQEKEEPHEFPGQGHGRRE